LLLIDADEPEHETCWLTLAGIELPLVTPWPAFTEAIYLLSRAGGPRGAQALWALVLTRRLEIADLSRSAIDRSSQLMAKYADLPMDLADATLVALAEARGLRRVFTFDSDFRVYRIHGRQRFDVIPG